MHVIIRYTTSIKSKPHLHSNPLRSYNLVRRFYPAMQRMLRVLISHSLTVKVCTCFRKSAPRTCASGTARANWFASNTMCPTKLRKKIKHVRLVFLACLRGNCCTRDNHWFEIQLGWPGHNPYSLETARKAWQSMKYANEQMHATMEGPIDDL